MSEYEFSDAENEVFTKLNKNMLLASLLLVLSGLVALILGITAGSVFDIISGITVITIGISLYFPTDNFRNIVSTTGEDIKELLTAFSELDKGWLIVNIISAIYLITKALRIFVDF